MNFFFKRKAKTKTNHDLRAWCTNNNQEKHVNQPSVPTGSTSLDPVNHGQDLGRILYEPDSFVVIIPKKTTQ